MRHAIAYEWTRIRTIRSTWWLTGLCIILGVGISVLMSWAVWHDFSTRGAQGDELDAIGPIVATQLGATGQVPSLVAFLVAIIGIFAWGHEYRHGMVRASLTALNSRGSLWIAKYVVCAAWAAATTAVTLILSALCGQLFLYSYAEMLSGQTWEFIGRTVVYAVILTCLGMAFTSVTRSQAFAMVTLFLWPLLVEHIISLVFRLVPGLRDEAELTRFLPFQAGSRLLDAISEGRGVFGDPMTGLGGFLVFGGCTASLMIVSFLLFRRRDA